MSTITVQDLQDIAVECAGEFFNNHTPLSVGLAKVASDRGLNSDQLRRAVEATNTVTYLKSLQVSPDRTGEFPLANYEEIVKLACVPDNLAGQFHEKVAAFEDDLTPEKAEAKLAFEFPSLTKQAALAMMLKEMAANRRAIEDKESYSITLARDLVKTAAELRRDPDINLKISAVTGNASDFQKIAKFVHGSENLDYKFQGYGEYVVEKRACEKVVKLQGMLKEAQEVVAELAYRKDLDKRAIETELMTKQAYLGAIGEGLGYLGGKVMSGLARVGTAAVVKPVTAAAKGIGNVVATGVKNKVGSITEAAQNAISKTGVGQELRVPAVEAAPKALMSGKAKTTLALGGAGMDAAFYTPGVNAKTGKTNNVWDAING